MLLSQNKIDIIALSETWLHEGIDEREILIPGYSIIRMDQPGNNSHGGTAIYISHRVSFHNITEIKTNSFESCWIEIDVKSSKSIILGVVYFPNKNTDYLDELDNTLNEIEKDAKEYIIVGDFNLDVFDLKENDKISCFCYDHQLLQLVEDPTRVTENSSTCIDLILSSHPETINKIEVVPLGLSDHSMVLLNRKLHTKMKQPEQMLRVRNCKHFDETAFKTTLTSMPWEIIESTGDVNEAWHIWKSMFDEACNMHAPFINFRRSNKHLAPWVTREMLKLGRRRDSLRAKAQKSGNP